MLERVQCLAVFLSVLVCDGSGRCYGVCVLLFIDICLVNVCMSFSFGNDQSAQFYGCFEFPDGEGMW